MNGTQVPGNSNGRTMDFQTIVDCYQRLLDRFPQIQPTLRRNMESGARSLNNENSDSQESSQKLSPSRSIDVYPFELDNGKTTHIIHADPQYADAALEHPLLNQSNAWMARHRPPNKAHCFVIIHNKVKITHQMREAQTRCNIPTNKNNTNDSPESTRKRN